MNEGNEKRSVWREETEVGGPLVELDKKLAANVSTIALDMPSIRPSSYSSLLQQQTRKVNKTTHIGLEAER